MGGNIGRTDRFRRIFLCFLEDLAMSAQPIGLLQALEQISTLVLAGADATRTGTCSRDACPHAAKVSPRLTRWDSRLGLQQACRPTRTTRRDGQKTLEVQYAITSLSPSEAGAAELLELWCHPWDIENRLHWVRDTAWERRPLPHPHAASGAAVCRLS